MKNLIKILFCVFLLIGVTGCSNENSTEITYSSKTEKYLNETGVGKTFVVTKNEYDSNTTKRYFDAGFIAVYYDYDGIDNAYISNNDGDYNINLTNKTGILTDDNPYSKISKELENRATPAIFGCSSYPEPIETGIEEIDGVEYTFEKFVRDQWQQPEAGSITYYFDTNDKAVYYNNYDDTEFSIIVQIIDYGTEFDNSVFEVPDDIEITDARPESLK